MSTALDILRIANVAIWAGLLAYMFEGARTAIIGKDTHRGDPEAHTTGGLIGVLGPSLKAYYPAISSEAGSVQFTVNFGATAWAYPLLAPSYAGWSTTTPPASLSTFRSARIAIRSAGNFAHAFAEWEMMTSSGGANILTGGTPTASHSLAGGAGALTSGFDGNTTTWTGVSTPSGATANQASAYFQYAFGSNAARNVTHLAIRGRDGGGGGQTQAPTAFDLYLSDDNAVFHKNNVGLSFGTFSGTTPGHRQELAL